MGVVEGESPRSFSGAQKKEKGGVFLTSDHFPHQGGFCVESWRGLIKNRLCRRLRTKGHTPGRGN